jgi:predicted dinucleotide-binding enzyme
LVLHRRRVEAGRRFGGQGDRELFAAAQRRKHRTHSGRTISGAEALTKKVAGAEVVAAFSNIPSEVLFGVFEARGKATPPSMVYCGDTDAGKTIAATLIRDVGFDPIDVGPSE